MFKRLKTLFLVVAGFVCLAFLVLVGLETYVGGSAGGTLATGRTVVAFSDSVYLSSSFSNDTATIQTGGKTIVVQPDGLVVNGTKVATIDGKSKTVEVKLKRGKITFVADGKPVVTRLQ